MKVTEKDFETLKSAIEPENTEARRQAYRDRKIPRAESVRDINKRYRWDLYYHAASLVGGLPDSTSGYNMDHLDTALRKIVPDIE
jgi:hypothetical protein